MKSKLIELADMKDVPIKDFVKKIPREQIEREVHAKELILRMSRRQVVKAETIAKSDIATLTLTSGNPWYQRESVKLNVGLELFSPALEEALVGRTLGERFTVDIESAQVQVTVQDIDRVIIPLYNDELISQVKPDGAETVEQ